jgi:hypothetical protein
VSRGGHGEGERLLGEVLRGAYQSLVGGEEGLKDSDSFCTRKCESIGIVMDR